ncbi:hypothetical protein Leryth_022397 [Lithospermum erythrorhizon]|nr:hypothetical protein Leryth_022397 [Lithospermum erythrorhizon]
MVLLLTSFIGISMPTTSYVVNILNQKFQILV